VGAVVRRDPALARLSRDHHQTLVIAQKLRRASGTTAVEARTAFLDHWDGDARHHFRLEEEVGERVSILVAPQGSPKRS
jgi:hypothetical protein